VFGVEMFRAATFAWASGCSVRSVDVIWRLANDCKWKVCGMCVVWMAI
jgi:hypothetical protein